MPQFITTALRAIIVLAAITTAADAANFKDETFGISIDVDDALTKQPLLRDIQYFKAEDSSGSLLIKRIHDLTIVDLVQELRDVGYISLRDGIDLRMDGEPIEAGIESGRGLLIPVRGRIRGQPITGVLGAYSGHQGQGFLVIGSAKPPYWAAWKPRMQTMFESIRFVEADRKAMIEEWQERLKDKKLQYKQADVKSKAPAGMLVRGAAQRDYHLCSDGTVMRKTGSVGQAAGPNMMAYGRSMHQGRGTWQVIVAQGMPLLIVRDGPEQEFLLEKDGDNFLLNGKPYIITDSDLCK